MHRILTGLLGSALVVSTTLPLSAGATARESSHGRVAAAEPAVGPPVIGNFKTITTIGSTVDPLNGDRNPHGLTIAPLSGGSIVAGDLIVSNFNDSVNIQGLGSTLELLAPTTGATPQRLAADPTLTGPSALAIGSTFPWVAALDANDNPIVTDTGAIATSLNNFAWTGPFGQAFVAGPSTTAAFYETNANDGSIVRINLTSPFTFDKIATGFPVNHGVPGHILAPSGLTYDPQRDILYFVDGAADAVFSLRAPGKIKAGGVNFTPFVGFSGPSASSARLLSFGFPLNAPISSTLLFNGDLVVGNTGNNDLVEINPFGRAVAVTKVDGGAAGALFGLVASGTSAASTRVFFNDDNDNTVKVLTP